MKLVIDIPEEYYKTIMETKKEVVPIGWVSIRNGIPTVETYTFEQVQDLVALNKKLSEEWKYLKEHITELRDANSYATQYGTCQFILNLMRTIEREGTTE